MINKTFNSDSTDGRALEVGRNGERPWLNIREFDLENTMFMLAPSDAPALALAILETAGYVANSADAGVQPGESCDDHFWDAAEILRAGIAIQTEDAAEARERAELEAEALELHNAFWAGLEEKQLDSWDDERGNAKNSWVSAARRARELAKEATK